MEMDIGKKIENYPLEAFIECIAENNDEMLGTIAQLFRYGSPNKSHFLVARLLEKGLVRDILTTNFDLLIERALGCLGWLEIVDYCVYHAEDQFRQSKSDLSLPAIFKIHGSADDEDSVRVALRHVAGRTLSERRAGIVKDFLTSGPGDILILGYGAADHFDINPILFAAESKKRIFYVRHLKGKSEIEPLPSAFQRFDGFSLLCDTEEVVDHLWRTVFNDEWTILGNQWNKLATFDRLPSANWNAVIDTWSNRIVLPGRFFITAWILSEIEQFDESFELYNLAKKIYENLGDTEGIAATLDELGMMEQFRGNDDEAAQLFSQSLEIRRRIEDKLGIARTLLHLAQLSLSRGDSETLLNQAKELCEKSGQQREMAGILGTLGLVEQGRRNYEKAMMLYGQAADIFEELGDQSNLARTLRCQLMIAIDTINLDNARRLFSKVLEIESNLGKELGDTPRIAALLNQLGMVEYLIGNLDEAFRMFSQAEDIFKTLGDQKGMAETLHYLATIAQSRRDYDKAIELFNRSLEIKRRIEDEHGIAETLHELGNIEYDKRSYDEAEAFYRQAKQIFEKLGDKGIAQTLHQLANIEYFRYNSDEAKTLYTQAKEISGQLGIQTGVFAALYGLAATQEQMGHHDDARRLYEQADEIFAKIDEPTVRPTQMLEMGHLAEDQKDFVAAEIFYNKAYKISERLGSKHYSELAKKDLERVQQKQKK
jgi:tetratricopeptide (TPR) repeat protein